MTHWSEIGALRGGGRSLQYRQWINLNARGGHRKVRCSACWSSFVSGAAKAGASDPACSPSSSVRRSHDRPRVPAGIARSSTSDARCSAALPDPRPAPPRARRPARHPRHRRPTNEYVTRLPACRHQLRDYRTLLRRCETRTISYESRTTPILISAMLTAEDVAQSITRARALATTTRKGTSGSGSGTFASVLTLLSVR